MKVIADGIFNTSETINYDDDYEEEPDERVKKTAWIAVLYSLLMIVGLFGNILLLAVLIRKRSSWSVSDSFVTQLCVVDILLLLTLPLWASNANQNCGVCSETVLKICAALFSLNFYVGVLLLVCICLSYCLSSIHGIHFSCHRASFTTVGCLGTWLLSLALTIVDWVLLPHVMPSSPGKALCLMSQSGEERQLMPRLLHLIFGFLLPVPILTVCSSHILLRLRRDVIGSRNQRPVNLILSLVTVFLLCWIPYNITLVVDVVCYQTKEIFRSFLKEALMVTSALACISAIIRPFLYFFLCESFRKQALRMLKCERVDCQSSLWELGIGKEASPDPHQTEETRQMSGSVQ